jgi:DNA-binding response OmpR family regulator
MQRILVVDDNKDILDLLKYVLEDSGYEVGTLANGNFLFDAIGNLHPDLILLDVMLGNVDGRELCKQLKFTPATHNIPIILISATHNMPSDITGGSPDGFLAKPFDINQLLDSIKKQLAA